MIKKYILLICIGLLGFSCEMASKPCDNGLIVRLLEDILRNSNLILPRTTDIQARIGDCTVDDAVILSLLDVIESLVEGISCTDTSSQLDVIESLIEGISSTDTSSQLDRIESGVDSVAECCASSSDVLGNLTDIGSCLDSTIDVPDDINNLSLTVISLLKTILLDLRGCNIT